MVSELRTLQEGYWFWIGPMLVAWQQPLRSPAQFAGHTIIGWLRVILQRI